VNFQKISDVTRRNLIIVRAGDDSFHSTWIQPGIERSFDLLVSYYGDAIGRFKDEAEHYHLAKGPRWPAHHWICENDWHLLEKYDHISFVCDDIKASPDKWNSMFEICGKYGLDIAQPAILGPVSWEITKPVERCLLRFTNFVEIMCPTFKLSTLKEIKWTFGESKSGWGLDLLWAHFLPFPKFRHAIIDIVTVEHTRPLLAGQLKTVLRQQGINSREEKQAILQRYGIASPQIRELGRLTLQMAS
jgi:hypothetical protein